MRAIARQRLLAKPAPITEQRVPDEEALHPKPLFALAHQRLQVTTEALFRREAGQALLDTLHHYVQTVTPTAPPKTASQP